MKLGVILWVLLLGLFGFIYFAGFGATLGLFNAINKIPVWGWMGILIFIFVLLMTGGKKR